MPEPHPLHDMEDDIFAVRELLETAMELFAEHLRSEGDLDHSIANLIYRLVRCADEKNSQLKAKWEKAFEAHTRAKAA
jgi:hypothetical protein